MITVKLLPIGFLSLGIFLLMQVILPIASFQIWELGQKYNNNGELLFYKRRDHCIRQ